MNELQQTFKRTRLSSNIQEMEFTLESQEEMWHDVKEDMASARQAGVTLLDCITVHRKVGEDRDKTFTPDVKANAAELKQALTQLEDLENNFERFWKDHKSKIKYGLKVCLFEREWSQVIMLLLSIMLEGLILQKGNTFISNFSPKSQKVTVAHGCHSTNKNFTTQT